MPELKKIKLSSSLMKPEFCDKTQIEIIESYLNLSQQDVWQKNEKHCFSYQNAQYELCFSHSIIRRKRKEGKEGYTFEIFDPQISLGKGGYGVTYPVLKSFKFNAHQIVLKEKKRVIKVEQHQLRDRKLLVRREYHYLKQANHLGVKIPLFSDTQSFLVMNRAQGFTLEELLYSNKALTVVQRMEITLALLQAIKTQVSDKGLIHRDLKPGNILIDLESYPLQVTIIDYGHAIGVGEMDNRRVGTRAYRAPETYASIPLYSPKVDFYAAGRILSYLWGDNYKNYYAKPQTPWQEIQKKSTNKDLFSHPKVNLFSQDQQIIRTCLGSLLHEDPDKRIDLDQAIEQFTQINWRKYALKGIKNFSKKQLQDYEHSLKIRIQNVRNTLDKFLKKGMELRDRGFGAVAQHIEQLHQQLDGHIAAFAADPDPAFIEHYRSLCFTEIKQVKSLLEGNRDSLWLIGEVLTAVALLGIFYAIALGVNYHLTGRVGLFARTETERLTEEFKNSVLALAP